MSPTVPTQVSSEKSFREVFQHRQASRRGVTLDLIGTTGDAHNTAYFQSSIVLRNYAVRKWHHVRVFEFDPLLTAQCIPTYGSTAFDAMILVQTIAKLAPFAFEESLHQDGAVYYREVTVDWASGLTYCDIWVKDSWIAAEWQLRNDETFPIQKIRLK